MFLYSCEQKVLWGRYGIKAGYYISNSHDVMETSTLTKFMVK